MILASPRLIVHQGSDGDTRSCLGRDGIKPTQTAKPRKITIGRAQRKSVFHGQRSEMSVWYEIAIYARQREKLT